MELHKDDSKNLITGEISMITSIHELCKKKNYIYVEQVMRPFDFNYINYFYYVEISERRYFLTIFLFLSLFSLFHPLKHERPFDVLQRRLCGHYACSLL